MRKFSISYVFYFVAFVSFLGVSLVGGVSALGLRDVMLADRYDKIEQITLGLNNFIQKTIAREQSGEITHEEAETLVRNTVQNFRYDGNNYLFMISYDFCVFSHAKTERIGGCKKLPQREIFNELAKQGGGFHEYETVKPGVEGENYPKVSYIHPIPQWNMYIGTGVYLDDVQGMFIDRLMEIVIAGVLVVIVVIGIGAYVGSSVRRTINVLTTRLTALAKGDTSVTFDIKGFITEVETMIESARVFRDQSIENQRLAEDQEKTRQEAEEMRRRSVRDVGDSLESAVDGVIVSLERASSSMTDQATSLSGLADDSSAQSTVVSNAAKATSENVQTVASAAEELASSNAEIGTQVNQAVNVAREATDEANRTNEVMRRLADSSDEIGNIVQLINDIANQTNLLALNATIESARAGDAGKGFAVVAGEVKNLAGQTASATEQITQQISTVQSDTKLAVDAIQEIIATISRVSEISSTISAAVEEQVTATQEIAHSAQEAATTTQDVAENIGGVSQSTEKTGTAAQSVSISAAEISDLSVKLRGEVNSFLQKMRME